MAASLVVSAICFQRADGAVLTVRKRGTTGWMLPGGKPEPGESAIECAIREVAEELAITVEADQLEALGTFETEAVNEVGAALIATVYLARQPVDPRPRAEIAAHRWSMPRTAQSDPTEAPLNRDYIYPLLLASE